MPAQVIVAKFSDHLLLRRQARIFRLHGIEISCQTMCGWMRSARRYWSRCYGRLCRTRHRLAHGRNVTANLIDDP